ncbi:YbjN domain-containing protein [uncultured Selenomonas sp.]|uniref:YbjN domain-containing protein n=1 Tax=uncultured Selenomonas sp. TaxID=159275 RepID=UPI0028D05544|nr:YbjN domain-containing protein [uncultured Selenomonas sp.]
MGLFDGFQGGEKIAVMSIHDAIKAELDRHEFNYEETDESGESRRERYIYMRNELENDEPVTVVIAIREYDHADGFIKIKIYDIAYLEEAENRAGLLAKLNEWNAEYRYTKFCLDRDQDVVVDIDLPLDLHKGVFQPESVMAMMALGMNIVEKVYDDLTALCVRGHRPRPQE